MATTTSLYDILEINTEASDVDIKKAYRQLSLRHHPDRPGGDSEKFKQISEAYEVLSDSQKRADYDRGGGGGGDFEMSTEDIHNINNIFSQFLGGRQNGQGGIHIHRMQRNGGGGGGIHEIFQGFGGGVFNSFILPPTIQAQIVISLDQAYTGCIIPIKFDKLIVKNDKRMVQPCEICVEIPEGVNDNETIVLEHCGNDINGVVGDVRVVIHIHNTTEFSLDNNLNLIYHKSISLKEALCGFSFDIPLITGKCITIKNINTVNTVKVIKPGFKQICHGFGMKRGSQIGNLVVEFDITFPESLTPLQKENLNSIL